MGSFRSTTERLERDAVKLTAADRPLDAFRVIKVEGRRKRVKVQAEVRPEDWLGEGESISYWGVLPHSVWQRVVASAFVVVGGKRIAADAGATIAARLTLGIIDWVIFDSEGQPVPWDPAHGEELLDGLPTAVVGYLHKHIGTGAPEPPHGAVDPDAPETHVDPETGDLEGPTVGEPSAAV